jgi:hypothetical protein
MKYLSAPDSLTSTRFIMGGYKSEQTATQTQGGVENADLSFSADSNSDGVNFQNACECLRTAAGAMLQSAQSGTKCILQAHQHNNTFERVPSHPRQRSSSHVHTPATVVEPPATLSMS